MSTILSSHPETSIWCAPSAPLKLHSRAREAETPCCAGVSVTKSLERIEMPLCIYDSRDGLGLFSQDPIGFAAGDANLYRYVGNSPTNARDPSGLFEDDDFTRVKDWWGQEYEVRNNWFAIGAGVVGANVFWGPLGGGPRVNPSPRGPSILDLEGSRKARQVYQEQFVKGQTGSSRASPAIPESELTAMATLAAIDVEFYGIATGLASSGSSGVHLPPQSKSISPDRVLNGSYRLTSPAFSPERARVLKEISDLKAAFKARNGKFVPKLSEAPVDAAGKRIYGQYNSKTNEITFYQGFDLSTMAHELLHFRQANSANRIGGNLARNLSEKEVLERQVELWLLDWGFTYCY